MSLPRQQFAKLNPYYSHCTPTQSMLWDAQLCLHLQLSIRCCTSGSCSFIWCRRVVSHWRAHNSTWHQRWSCQVWCPLGLCVVQLPEQPHQVLDNSLHELRRPLPHRPLHARPGEFVDSQYLASSGNHMLPDPTTQADVTLVIVLRLPDAQRRGIKIASFIA